MPGWLVVSGLLVLGSCRSNSGQQPAATTSGWLLARAQQETELAARSAAFHDFRFADRVAESGIRFETRIVDDAGKAYKHVQYDHGTGLAAADVDGDGLPDLYFVTQLGSNELWKNLGAGRFADFTDSAGWSHRHSCQSTLKLGCSGTGHFL